MPAGVPSANRKRPPSGAFPLTQTIDQPLGNAKPPRPPRARRLPAIPWLQAATALAIVAGSAWIATRDDGFRPATPREVEVAVAEPTPAPAPATPPTAAPAPTDMATQDGPSIVRVGSESPPASNVIVIRDPATLASNPRTAHLPVPELIEEGPEGPLPVRGAEGLRPFDAYAGKWSGSRGAKVAIVIGGLGLSQTGTQEAIKALPSEVTLGFAPQGNSLTRWMQTARREGHEIVMQIPLEPFDFPAVNPGRNTLTVEAGAEANRQNLLWALARTTNYTGVMNYMGGRFVTDRAAMTPVMQELGRRGLLYLDDGSSARSLASELAPGSAVPFSAADTPIDAVRERGAILKQLDSLEATARAKGMAVGIGSAFDVTIAAVTQWVAEAKKRGIEIVPVSATAADPERRR